MKICLRPPKWLGRPWHGPLITSTIMCLVLGESKVRTVFDKIWKDSYVESCKLLIYWCSNFIWSDIPTYIVTLHGYIYKTCFAIGFHIYNYSNGFRFDSSKKKIHWFCSYLLVLGLWLRWTNRPTNKLFVIYVWWEIVDALLLLDALRESTYVEYFQNLSIWKIFHCYDV